MSCSAVLRELASNAAPRFGKCSAFPGMAGLSPPKLDPVSVILKPRRPRSAPPPGHPQYPHRLAGPGGASWPGIGSCLHVTWHHTWSHSVRPGKKSRAGAAWLRPGKVASAGGTSGGRTGDQKSRKPPAPQRGSKNALSEFEPGRIIQRLGIHGTTKTSSVVPVPAWPKQR